MVKQVVTFVVVAALSPTADAWFGKNIVSRVSNAVTDTFHETVDGVKQAVDAITGAVDTIINVGNTVIDATGSAVDSDSVEVSLDTMTELFKNPSLLDKCETPELCKRISDTINQLKSSTTGAITELYEAQITVSRAWGDASGFLTATSAKDATIGSAAYLQQLLTKAYELVPYMDGSPNLDDAWGYSQEAIDSLNSALKKAALFDYASDKERMTAFFSNVKASASSAKQGVDLKQLTEQAAIYGELFASRAASDLTTLIPSTSGGASTSGDASVTSSNLSRPVVEIVDAAQGLLDKVKDAFAKCKKSLSLDSVCTSALVSAPTTNTVDAINAAASKMCADSADCAKDSLLMVKDAVNCAMKPFEDEAFFNGWDVDAKNAFISSAKGQLEAQATLKEEQLANLCQQDLLSGNYCDSAILKIKTAFPKFDTESAETQCAIIKRSGCCGAALHGYLSTDAQSKCDIPTPCAAVDEVTKGLKMQVKVEVDSLLSKIPGITSTVDLANKLNADPKFFSRMQDKLSSLLNVDASTITIADIDLKNESTSIKLDVLVNGASDDYDAIKTKVLTLVDSGEFSVDGSVFVADAAGFSVAASSTVTKEAVLSNTGGSVENLTTNDGSAVHVSKIAAFTGLAVLTSVLM